MLLMRRLNLALLILAGIALFFSLRSIDWPALLHSFALVGAYWPLLFLPYALTAYFWTLSWRFLLVGQRGLPPMHRLFFLRLAGDALNQLTPTASLGGEPFKAVRLHDNGMPWQDATASLVINKALMVLSLVVYVILSLALVPLVLPGLPENLALLVTVGTLLLTAGGLLFVLLQRRQPCTSFLKLLRRFGICPAVLSAKEPELAALDDSLTSFYRDHPRAGLLAFLFYFLGWAIHAAEVFLIFRLLGHPVGFTMSICLDALSQLVAAMGFMIPASFGIQDGGNILLSLGFNLGATLGAGFSILRRFREAFWLLLGLLFVAKEK